MSDKKHTLLSVENLSAVYFAGREKTQAVEKLSFEINEGSVFAIVGKSGCGKTTAALSILRLIPKHRGKITGGGIYLKSRFKAPIPLILPTPPICDIGEFFTP